MTAIGNMLWRIGELLDFDRQLEWTRDAGFDGVGFHANTGVPGKWCGLEPSACNAGERKRLRRLLQQFAFSEIHAPFDIELRTGSLPADVPALTPILELAQDLGVDVVTVHAQVCGPNSPAELAAWDVAMRDLNSRAERAGVTIALEIADGFDVVAGWGLPNVGINLDVGHMYCQTNRRALTDFRGIACLIRHLGSALRHLHLHDVDNRGMVDHIELGTGIVEFSKVAAALCEIDYRHAATLELNPDRVSPEGIRRSLAHVRNSFREVHIA